jgi:hypothetical protein
MEGFADYFTFPPENDGQLIKRQVKLRSQYSPTISSINYTSQKCKYEYKKIPGLCGEGGQRPGNHGHLGR